MNLTPKEEAKRLVDKMHLINSIKVAKLCAIIAVNEILKETKLHDKTTYQHGRTAYWNEVKLEIEKL